MRPRAAPRLRQHGSPAEMSSMQPLEGIVVLDFSTLLPGPMATLLLAEAGGVMTDIHGHPIRFNRKQVKLDGFVAAGPALHAALSRLLIKK